MSSSAGSVESDPTESLSMKNRKSGRVTRKIVSVPQSFLLRSHPDSEADPSLLHTWYWDHGPEKCGTKDSFRGSPVEVTAPSTATDGRVTFLREFLG